MKTKSAVAKSLFSFFVKVPALYSRSAIFCLDRWLPSKRSRLLDVLAGVLPTILLYPLYRLGDHLVFSKVKQKLGTSFIAGVSGGGSLSAGVDMFFASIGVKLLDGYGLTESAPVVAVRPLKAGVKRTVSPLPGTEVRIVDEAGNETKPGSKGSGDGSPTAGYEGLLQETPDLTDKVLSKEGWLDPETVCGRTG